MSHLPPLKKLQRDYYRYLRQMAIYVVASMLFIGLGTYLIWKIGRYYSPTLENSDAQTTVTLKVSERAQACNDREPLINSLTANDSPCYDNYAQPTEIKEAGGQFPLFRLQGEVTYK